jgi:general secretion pathway protein A
MILDYYKLAESPFGDTPDPRFLYLGPQHREALASLMVGTESNRGFLAVIAQPGMGKTSLLYQYLQTMRRKARTAFVFQTDCDSREFIRHILVDLGIDAAGKDLPAMRETLNRLLADEAQAGRRFLLVIDEAQNLEEKTLESVRLLSNFETPWSKLMQIVLVGQPQLARRLAKPSMVQLRQRLSMIIRLEPLNFEEVRNYINHRLSTAGYDGPSLFTLAARRLIAERSQGIPRNINTICFNAMALACAMKLSTIDHNVVLEVLADLDLNSLQGEAVISHATELKRMLLQASATKKEMPLQASATKKEKTGLRGVLSKFAAAGLLLALVLGLPFSLNNRESQTAATANLSGASAPVSLNTASPSAVPFHEHEVAPVETVADRQVDRP